MLFFRLLLFVGAAFATLEDPISVLQKRLLKDQTATSRTARFGVFGKERGIWPSDVKVNLHGRAPLPLVRKAFRIPDDNGFVTQFVLAALIEAVSLHGIEATDALEKAVAAGVEACVGHRDRNFADGVPVYAFWNQELMNGSHVSFPNNLGKPLETLAGFFGLLQKTFAAFGLDALDHINDVPNLLINAFKIPADSDDTGVNLALGALLRDSPFTAASQYWEARNWAFENATAAVTRHAYRPLSHDLSLNTLDPRSYLWMRGFLQREKARAQQGKRRSELLLIPTWLIGLEESVAGASKGWQRTPFTVNNVDPSVCANFLFGLSYTMLQREHVLALLTGDLAYMYEDSIDLLVWVLEENILAWRPDAALLYYPPVNDFYYFVARLYALLETHAPLAHPLLERARVKLRAALQAHATPQLLARRNADGLWDDFLGLADSDLFGNAKPTHDDRVFTTSSALLALYAIWAPGTRGGWIAETSAAVREAAAHADGWLRMHIRSGSRSGFENAFFAGSVKGSDNLPYWYPANVRLAKYGGPALSCNATIKFTDSDVFVGVSGVMDEATFLALQTQPCFHHNSTPPFMGYNSDGAVFPYWSSPSLSRANALLALVKGSYLT